MKIATAAAALAVGEASPRTRTSLSNLLLTALTVEMAATLVSDHRFKQTGIEAGRSGPWGQVEKIGATGLGVMLPIGLLVASRLGKRDTLTTAAGIAALAGSAMMRISMLGVGMESARRPEISMRFAQPDNLPKP